MRLVVIILTIKKKILIIDDEEDITFILRIILERNNFTVYTFNDPIIALSNYHPHCYDLVILDLKLPQISGFEIHDRIRAMDRETKVCFLTSSELIHEKYLNNQCNRADKKLFIQKPVENQLLVRKINDMLNDNL